MDKPFRVEISSVSLSVLEGDERDWNEILRLSRNMERLLETECRSASAEVSAALSGKCRTLARRLLADDIALRLWLTDDDLARAIKEWALTWEYDGVDEGTFVPLMFE